MKQGTTPILRLNVPKDLTGKTVYITIEGAKGNQITYRSDNPKMSVEPDEEKTLITLRFDQADTFALDVGMNSIEARWIGGDGRAYGTKKKSFNVSKPLLQQIIEYIGGDS